MKVAAQPACDIGQVVDTDPALYPSGRSRTLKDVDQPLPQEYDQYIYHIPICLPHMIQAI